MKKFNKAVIVPTIILCTLGWGVFASKAMQDNHTEDNSNVHKYTSIEIEKMLATYKFVPPFDNIKKEIECLKEEERKRLEELERQRLERLEKIRLEKIEEAKKIAEQKRIEELKKQQQGKIVSREETSNGNKSYYNVTFYTAGVESTGKSRGDKGYGITASGTTVSEGRTVACPKSIPFGTKIHIEGFGYRICEDRGGAIVEGHLDIYVDSLTKARKLGRQKLLVTILSN